MKLKGYIAAAALIALMSVNASAEIVVTKDRSGGGYTVSGSVEGTGYKSDVSMIVTDANDSIIYADYTDTADGKISAQFKMPKNTESGEYCLRVGSYDADEAQKSMFYYVCLHDKAQIIAKIQAEIKQGMTKESFVEKVRDNSAVLELGDSVSAPVGQARLESVYGDLYDHIAKNGISSELDSYIKQNDITADFDAFVSFIEENEITDDFSDAYYRCLSVYALADSANENAGAVLGEFSEYYGFEDESCYPITENKWFSNDALIKRLAGKPYASLGEIKSVYNEQVFLEGIHSADDYNYVMLMFERYAQAAGVSKEYYNKVGASKAAVGIVGKSFDSAALLDAYIRSLYSEPSSGGGGGGSSGGGISVSSDIYNQYRNEAVYNRFNDLSKAVWAAEAIEYLAERNIISGYEDGSFKPNDTLTREALAKMIVDAKGVLDTSAECEYTDVPGDFWAYRYIASACVNEIASGMGDGRFGTGQPVTRQDMAVMLARAAGLDMSGSLCDFTDFDEVSGYARAGVCLMKEKGIINGYEDGSFRPMANATRAEAAKIIYDMLKGGLL